MEPFINMSFFSKNNPLKISFFSFTNYTQKWGCQYIGLCVIYQVAEIVQRKFTRKEVTRVKVDHWANTEEYRSEVSTT